MITIRKIAIYLELIKVYSVRAIEENNLCQPAFNFHNSLVKKGILEDIICDAMKDKYDDWYVEGIECFWDVLKAYIRKSNKKWRILSRK